MLLQERLNHIVTQIRLDHTKSAVLSDIEKRRDASGDPPKPCGKGWVGTKPGCKRAQKGTASVKEKSAKTSSKQAKTGHAEEKPPGKKTSSKKAATSKSSNSLLTKSELLQAAKSLGIKDAEKMSQEDLFKSVTNHSFGGKYDNIGEKVIISPDKVNHSGAKDIKKQVEILSKSGSEFNWNPALVVESGAYQYKAVDDASSSRVAATQKTGKQLAAIMVPDIPQQIALAKTLSSHPDIQASDSSIKKSSYQRESRAKYSTDGDLMHLPSSGVSKGSGKHSASEADIENAAKELIKSGGRNWLPVLVREVSPYQYEVVGNHFVYDVAKKAGLERMWTVVVPNHPDEVAIAKAQASQK